MLLAEILAYISPMRERRDMYAADPEKVRAILETSKEKVHAIAETKMNIVRANIGVA